MPEYPNHGKRLVDGGEDVVFEIDVVQGVR